MQSPWEKEFHFRGRDGFAIEPDYKIEEIFDPETMAIYFMVWKMKPVGDLLTDRKFDTLGEAEECVRMSRKYKNRVFHYVNDLIRADAVIYPTEKQEA